MDLGIQRKQRETKWNRQWEGNGREEQGRYRKSSQGIAVAGQLGQCSEAEMEHLLTGQDKVSKWKERTRTKMSFSLEEKRREGEVEVDGAVGVKKRKERSGRLVQRVKKIKK